jgi:hypothetical protein
MTVKVTILDNYMPCCPESETDACISRVCSALLHRVNWGASSRYYYYHLINH